MPKIMNSPGKCIHNEIYFATPWQFWVCQKLEPLISLKSRKCTSKVEEPLRGFRYPSKLQSSNEIQFFETNCAQLSKATQFYGFNEVSQKSILKLIFHNLVGTRPVQSWARVITELARSSKVQTEIDLDAMQDALQDKSKRDQKSQVK